MNAHGLICGGTGSGKSSLLHMLISSIVMNYTPEDVEIWLSDYKITEFLFLQDQYTSTYTVYWIVKDI